jgi:hypothetical protein
VGEIDDPKSKKKDNKKKETHVELHDTVVDATGRRLPRIVMADDWNTSTCLQKFKKGVSIHIRESKPTEEKGTTVDSSSSSESEVDSLMCAAFTSIARSWTLCGGDDRAFLWRHIYPQTAEGRPCYNPAGKYIVRLFLAGKWRRVHVNDTIPVDVNGVPLCAGSADNFEIWPTLLSKAIYTVIHACG